MKKKLLAMLMMFVLAISATACGNQGSEKESDTATAGNEGYITITDHRGVEVQVPKNIQRVVIDQVPLTTTYCMYMGGNTDKLVGLSQSVVDVLSKSVLKDISPETLKVETGFYKVGELNIEELEKLDPDVVLFNASNQEHAKLFEQAGIPAVGFSTVGLEAEPDPTKLYAEWLRLLEDVFQEDGKMDAAIAYGDKLIASTKEKISKNSADPVPNALILFSYSDGAPSVAGTGHFGGKWLDSIGANNVARDIKGVKATTVEQIYQWDPDLIFMPGLGQSKLTPEDLYGNKIDNVDWSPITAVQNKNVFTSNLGMWSWYVLSSDSPLVHLWLAKSAYPQTFADVDLKQTIKEYYHNFYKYDLSDTQIEQIINPQRN